MSKWAHVKGLVAVVVLAALPFSPTALAQTPEDALPLLCRLTGEIDIQDLPTENLDVDVCNLVGRVVRHGAAAAAVPPPGEVVWTEALGDLGATTLELAVDASGVLTTSTESPQTNEGGNGGPDPCGDTAYSTLEHRPQNPFNYFMNPDLYRPSSLTRDQAIQGLKSGFDVIYTTANDCGFSDANPFTAAIIGTGSYQPDITSRGACNSTSDGYNEVGFGVLPNGIFAVTCSRRPDTLGRDPVLREGDIKYNSPDYNFVLSITSACSHSVHLPSVAAHEVGHLFGLNHVSESAHPRMTMSTNMDRCDFGAATLGQGDRRGVIDRRDE